MKINYHNKKLNLMKAWTLNMHQNQLTNHQLLIEVGIKKEKNLINKQFNPTMMTNTMKKMKN